MEKRTTPATSLLDIIKLPLTFYVLWVHSSLSPDTTALAPETWTIVSRVAMGIFLTISGFLLYRKLSTSDSPHAYLNHYITRAATVYVVWAVIYLPVTFGAYDSTVYSPSDVVRIWFHGLLTDSPGMGFHLWYVYMLVFSAIFVKIAWRHTRRPLAWLLALTLAGRVVSYLWNGPETYAVFGFKPLRFLFTSGYYFTFGMALACYLPWLSSRRRLMAAATVAVLAGAVLAPSFGARLIPFILVYWLLTPDIRLSEEMRKSCRYYSSMMYYSHIAIFWSIAMLLPINNRMLLFAVSVAATLLVAGLLRAASARLPLLRILYAPSRRRQPTL